MKIYNLRVPIDSLPIESIIKSNRRMNYILMRVDFFFDSCSPNISSKLGRQGVEFLPSCRLLYRYLTSLCSLNSKYCQVTDAFETKWSLNSHIVDIVYRDTMSFHFVVQQWKQYQNFIRKFIFNEYFLNYPKKYSSFHNDIKKLIESIGMHKILILTTAFRELWWKSMLCATDYSCTKLLFREVSNERVAAEHVLFRMQPNCR